MPVFPAIMTHMRMKHCVYENTCKSKAKRLHYTTRHNCRPLSHSSVSTATFLCANIGRALEEPSVSSGRWLWRQKQRRTCGVSHHDAHWGSMRIDTSRYILLRLTVNFHCFVCPTVAFASRRQTKFI